MPKFVIEREVPGVGNLTPDQIGDAGRKSNAAIRELGAKIKWITSYITGDKVYCVFVAPDEDAIREHARTLGLPANKVSRVAAMMDPATGE